MRIVPKVAISPVPRDVREAPSTEIATTPPRLQTLRAMLDEGDYPVDLDRLAARIADSGVLRARRS